MHIIKIIKFLEEDIGLSNGLIDTAPKAQAAKEK